LHLPGGQLRVGATIADNDLMVKLKLAQNFLSKGYRVRVSVAKGRKPEEALATFEVPPCPCSVMSASPADSVSPNRFSNKWPIQ
jgi:hypothetical protein